MQNPASLRTFGRYASLNILGMIGISCYILADTFFISLGTGAVGLAALNLAIPAFNIMNGIGQMIGVGSATHYTLCRARQQPEEADAAFTHAVRFGLAAGLLFLLLGLTAAGPLARLLGARPDTFALTTVYLRTFLLFSPFFVMNNVLLAFVRNDGDPRRAMCGMMAGSFANIIMDYVFIFPMGMGMFGAALATGFSPIISLLILSGHLRQSGRGFHLRSGRLRPALLPPLCAPGLPALISEISSAVILFLFNLVLLRLAGTTGVAAYGIIANFALVGIAVFSGLSTGMQPLVSQCSGCQNDLRRLPACRADHRSFQQQRRSRAHRLRDRRSAPVFYRLLVRRAECHGSRFFQRLRAHRLRIFHFPAARDRRHPAAAICIGSAVRGARRLVHLSCRGRRDCRFNACVHPRRVVPQAQPHQITHPSGWSDPIVEVPFADRLISPKGNEKS